MGRGWKTSEIKYIRQHYRKQPAKVIAKKLDRTVYSIWSMAGKLGLKPSKAWTIAEDKTLSEMVENGFSIKEIAIALNRSYYSITNRKRLHNERLL